MSFFNFNQTEILPYSKTNAAKRDARIQENLKNYNESLKSEKEINLYKEQVQADLQKEQNAKNLINNRTLMRKKRLQEDVKLEKNLTNKTLAKYLAEMVVSSLVFDEEFINEQKSLTSKIATYIESMINEGVINENSFTKNGNLLMEDAYYELSGLVKEKIRNRDSVDVFSESVIDEILSEAKKSKDLSDEIADTVKGKVSDTIKQEKKISKKKEEEKEDEDEMQKEISDAADSLDDDEDIDDSEDVDSEEDELSDEELDQMEKETADEELDDSDEGLDDLESGEDENLEEPTEGSEDMTADGTLDDATSDSENTEEALDNTSAEEPSIEADAEQSSNNTMEITIKTDGKNVSVNANQSESTEFLNIFGKSRYIERNSKSLFRNLLEGNVAYHAGLLSESNNETGVKMDLILAETITEYTLLETLFTSKIFNISNSQLKSIMKTINFNRK